MSNLFSDFPTTTKAEWLQKVAKDLKGRPIEDLEWHLDEKLSFTPFYHPEDQAAAAPSIDMGKTEANDWAIGALVETTEPKAANQQLLSALAGGVNSPLLKPKSDADLPLLLAEVQLPYVSLHIDDIQFPEQGHALLQTISQQASFQPDCKGSLYLSPTADAPLASWQSLLQYAMENTPSFHICTIDGRQDFAGTQSVPQKLSKLLQQAAQFLADLVNAGFSAAQVAGRMQFAVSIGTSFFVEIAKLRALRLLWANVLKAYKLDLSLQLHVHLAMPENETDPHTNMIRASTQALSAAIGGCNTLFVPPATQNTPESAKDFHYRIARNVQHILKMESYLDRVTDPAAGSYYIEKLTERFAEEAWKEFQQA